MSHGTILDLGPEIFHKVRQFSEAALLFRITNGKSDNGIQTHDPLYY